MRIDIIFLCYVIKGNITKFNVIMELKSDFI
jgi:hypothetical protein